VILVGAAVIGVGAFSKLQTNGAFQDPSADSTTAQRQLDEHFGDADNVVLLVRARGGTVDDPAVTAAGATAARRLSAEPRVTDVVSFWAPTIRRCGLQAADTPWLSATSAPTTS
jgi:putative drug exporter of the RND superfamily